jgi:hypothetical protein
MVDVFWHLIPQGVWRDAGLCYIWLGLLLILHWNGDAKPRTDSSANLALDCLGRCILCSCVAAFSNFPRLCGLRALDRTFAVPAFCCLTRLRSLENLCRNVGAQCDPFVAHNTPSHVVWLDKGLIRHSFKSLEMLFIFVAMINGLRVAKTRNITRIRVLAWNDATCLILGSGGSRVRIESVTYRTRNFLLLLSLLLKFLV